MQYQSLCRDGQRAIHIYNLIVADDAVTAHIDDVCIHRAALSILAFNGILVARIDAEAFGRFTIDKAGDRRRVIGDLRIVDDGVIFCPNGQLRIVDGKGIHRGKCGKVIPVSGDSDSDIIGAGGRRAAESARIEIRACFVREILDGRPADDAGCRRAVFELGGRHRLARCVLAVRPVVPAILGIPNEGICLNFQRKAARHFRVVGRRDGISDRIGIGIRQCGHRLAVNGKSHGICLPVDRGNLQILFQRVTCARVPNIIGRQLFHGDRRRGDGVVFAMRLRECIVARRIRHGDDGTVSPHLCRRAAGTVTVVYPLLVAECEHGRRARFTRRVPVGGIRRFLGAPVIDEVGRILDLYRQREGIDGQCTAHRRHCVVCEIESVGKGDGVICCIVAGGIIVFIGQRDVGQNIFEPVAVIQPTLRHRIGVVGGIVAVVDPFVIYLQRDGRLGDDIGLCGTRHDGVAPFPGNAVVCIADGDGHGIGARLCGRCSRTVVCAVIGCTRIKVL